MSTKEDRRLAKIRRERARYQANRKAILAKMAAKYHSLSPADKRARSYANRLRSIYKISAERVEKLKIAQGNVCAICALPAEKNKNGVLFIDHCHATGGLRGLLCDKCNRMLGSARDNPEILRKGAEYLDFARIFYGDPR